jgi:putative transposase
VTKRYQTKDVDTSAIAVPERVSVAMAEVAKDVRGGLLALAVGAGLQVMAALMDADVTAVWGPRGKHNAQRAALRHGSDRGSVTLGGRRAAVQRPRVRAADGSGDLAVPAYELFTGTEVMGRMAMERMLAGLSTRRYAVALEPVGEHVEREATSTSKSAVCRKFVAMTETALADLLAADLSGLDLVALMVDGVHFAESCFLVALGIDIDGGKHPLAASLREGLAETLTVLRLGVPPTLARTLRWTNAVDSMISICRDRSKNVKRWRDGQMALRWCAAGMVEAAKQFRRVNGHMHLPALRAALERHVADQTVRATRQDDTATAA